MGIYYLATRVTPDLFHLCVRFMITDFKFGPVANDYWRRI